MSELRGVSRDTYCVYIGACPASSSPISSLWIIIISPWFLSAFSCHARWCGVCPFASISRESNSFLSIEWKLSVIKIILTTDTNRVIESKSEKCILQNWDCSHIRLPYIWYNRLEESQVTLESSFFITSLPICEVVDITGGLNEYQPQTFQEKIQCKSDKSLLYLFSGSSTTVTNPLEF